jgi:NAD(P)H-flavin reductase
VHVTLLYSNKTPEDIIFHKELQGLESRNSYFRCVHTISRSEGYDWKGPTGRIHQELLEQNVSNKQALFYICGPKAMIQATVELLKGLGVHPSHLKIEKWD